MTLTASEKVADTENKVRSALYRRLDRLSLTTPVEDLLDVTLSFSPQTRTTPYHLAITFPHPENEETRRIKEDLHLDIRSRKGYFPGAQGHIGRMGGTITIDAKNEAALWKYLEEILHADRLKEPTVTATPPTTEDLTGYLKRSRDFTVRVGSNMNRLGKLER